jgi:hypothetical protein
MPALIGGGHKKGGCQIDKPPLFVEIGQLGKKLEWPEKWMDSGSLAMRETYQDFQNNLDRVSG